MEKEEEGMKKKNKRKMKKKDRKMKKKTKKIEKRLSFFLLFHIFVHNFHNFLLFHLFISLCVFVIFFFLFFFFFFSSLFFFLAQRLFVSFHPSHPSFACERALSSLQLNLLTTGPQTTE